MKEIYRNNYGVTYKTENHPNKEYNIQLVINNVGLFMTSKELQDLLIMVQSYDVTETCNCEQCKGQKLNKLGRRTNLTEFFIRVDERILGLLEDLIIGTQFILNIDAVLIENSIQ